MRDRDNTVRLLALWDRAHLPMCLYSTTQKGISVEPLQASVRQTIIKQNRTIATMFEDIFLPPKNLFFSQIKKRKARVQKVGKKKGEQ